MSEERRALEPIGITEVCGMEYHSSVTMVKGQKVNRIIFGVYFSKSIVLSDNLDSIPHSRLHVQELEGRNALNLLIQRID